MSTPAKKPRVEVRSVSDLTPDAHNANKGTQRGDYALGRSLERHGAGRSILADKEGRIIAGNKTFQKYGEQGGEDVIVVHTTGDQLVVVQRDDLDLEDAAARELAYADNRVAELDLAWDAEQVARDISAGTVDLESMWLPAELERLFANPEAGGSTGGGPVVDPYAEWQGMPEFVQEDKSAPFKCIVNFKCEEDLLAFEAFIGQRIPRNNYSIWYPEVPRTHNTEYQRVYDTFAPTPGVCGTGSGPARNFAWDHAQANGHARHWCLDDNIRAFHRLNRNRCKRVLTPAIFTAMEDFVDRYTNVAIAGPQYQTFRPKLQKCAPFTLNSRIYSCLLIDTALPLRWRGRYNEDTDLCLRVLKAGLCTVLFNALLQDKSPTQSIGGGNTDSIYSIGTLAKSQMLVAMHPDVARLAWRWGRWHHYVDYRRFTTGLVRRPGVEVGPGVDDYGMELRPLTERPE